MENEMETTEQDNLEALPAVALARFIAGTITEGCGCDECLNRRDMVTTLVMGRNDISMTALAKAVANKDWEDKDMEDLFDDPYQDPELTENIRLGLALDPDTYLTRDGRYTRKRKKRSE